MSASPRLGFAAYETPFAPCGGVAAVMGRLPSAMARVSGLPTAVVTPFFHHIEKTAALLANPDLREAGSFEQELDGRKIKTEILHLGRDGVDWLFLRPEDEGVFAASPHPYRCPDDILFRDALFFGAASRKALDVFAPGGERLVFLQDWQAACAALAPPPGGMRFFLTLHNTYDHPLEPGEVERFGLGPIQGDTVLQAALKLAEPTVFTVSGQFARDILEEPFQTEVMAPHLQEGLRGRLLGVNNGAFTASSLPEAVLNDLVKDETGSLLAWKRDRRRVFLRGLETLDRGPNRPVWGRPEEFARHKGPWFVMAGRDDPRQKGYELAAKVAGDYFTAGGAGSFLFFPIPGDEGLAGLGFLEELAENRPDRVLAFPFFYKEGYAAAMQGADFGLMPSYYEPFGMANEIMLGGTPAIARATGGIVQQVVPVPAGVGRSPSVQRRTALWHTGRERPTGLLYREQNNLPSARGDWRAINRADYRLGFGLGNRLDERSRYPLFRSMAQALSHALFQAQDLRESDPQEYGRLIADGLRHIEQNFTWPKAARIYLRAAGVTIRPRKA